MKTKSHLGTIWTKKYLNDISIVVENKAKQIWLAEIYAIIVYGGGKAISQKL